MKPLFFSHEHPGQWEELLAASPCRSGGFSDRRRRLLRRLRVRGFARSPFDPDRRNKRFILDMDVDRLKSAPGFDNDRWPDMTDVSWARDIDGYYGIKADRPTDTASYM